MIRCSDLAIEVTRHEDTIFIPLPPDAWQPISGCRCCCKFCKEHPHLTPYYDTLTVSVTGKCQFTGFLHNPTLANPLGRKTKDERLVLAAIGASLQLDATARCIRNATCSGSWADVADECEKQASVCRKAIHE